MSAVTLLMQHGHVRQLNHRESFVSGSPAPFMVYTVNEQ